MLTTMFELEIWYGWLELARVISMQEGENSEGKTSGGQENAACQWTGNYNVLLLRTLTNE